MKFFWNLIHPPLKLLRSLVQQMNGVKGKQWMMYEEEKVDKISIGNLKKVLDVEEVCTV